MGLRCLLGHDFGEPETERERNEEGNEVVVTVREVKTCRRCGEKQVVSENKEIKSIDQLRESANVGTTSQPTSSEPSASPGTDDWSMDDAGTEGGDGPTTTGSSTNDSKDQWTAEELMGDSDTGPSASEETVAPDDDVDKGVAEIIESAEKDDDMLRTDEAEPSPESAAGDEAEADDDADETPVHPGQRSPDDHEEPDTSDEDAEILDDDSPPEEAREQWDEQADPDEVPGRDPVESDPEVPEGEDAVIMGEDDTASAEPEHVDVADTGRDPTDEGPTAVEDEDAIIMGEDDPEPGQNEPVETTERDDSGAADATDDEDAEIMGETTESGHAPWPETPGEDEGHDASEPDGEPADLEFGGGVTPDQSENEQNGSQESAAEEPESDDPVTESVESGTSVPEPNINLEQSSREAKLEYYCAECGLTQEVGNSSMRAGDICPECRKGYITERQKAE